MIRINVYEAKTHFSRYLERIASGETIVLCRRNVPIAEIRPLPAARRKSRPIGLAGKGFQVPPAFFEPLPEDFLDAFGGKVR